MSDIEDILGDDSVDPGYADDTYNLGNEEEDILLADDTFELHYETPKQPIIQEKPPELAPVIADVKIDKPQDTKEIRQIATVDKHILIEKPVQLVKQIQIVKKEPVIADRPIIQHKPLPEKVAVVQPEPAPLRRDSNPVVSHPVISHPVVSQINNHFAEDEVVHESQEADNSERRNQKERPQEEPRYRAGHRERFPTERENDKPPRAAPHIPDTLDSVVTAESPHFQGGRGSQHFRGDKRQAGRGRDRYFPERPVDNGGNFRPYPDFRRHPNAPLPAGNYIHQPNRDFGPPFQSDSRSFGPDFNAPPADFQRGPPQDGGFMGQPEENGGFPPRQDLRNAGRPFFNAPRFPSDMNRRPPVGLVPPLFETFHGSDFRHVSSAPPAFQGLEGPPAKKVLINPHFKGPLPPPPQRLVYPTSRPPPGLEMRQRPPPLGDRSVHMSVPPPFLPAGIHHNDGFPSRNVQYMPDGRRGPGEMGYGGPPPFGTMNAGAGPPETPVSEETLERLTEQFIDEQRRCLQKAKVARNDDFFEKTQRFIENTTKDVRSVEPMMAVDPAEAEKERLRRKQEDFINANRHNLSLNLRRRRLSPPKAKPRKPLPPATTRKRSRSPLPQTQNSTSPSDPEERDYRLRLREQAEMRERVLLAKERRRRRDANNTNTNAETVSTHSVAPDNAAATMQENKRRPNTPPKYSARSARPADSPPRHAEPRREAAPAIRVETVSSTSTQPEAVTSTKPPPAPTSEDKLLQDNDIDQFLDDLLEDDALHLSAADEDLLLSDEDSGRVSPRATKPTRVNRPAARIDKRNLAEPKQSPVKRDFNNSAVSASPVKPTVGVKRPAVDSVTNKTDLRSKLARGNETAVSAQEKEKEKKTSRQVQPRRQIIYSDVEARPPAQPARQAQQTNTKEKVPQTAQSPDKWRSTFTEQKAKRMAPIAVRAISAVVRTAASEAGVRKVIPPTRQAQPSKAALTQEDSPPREAARSGGGGGIFGGRRVVLGGARASEAAGANPARVVLPRQKRQPLLVVEKEEEGEEPEPYDQEEEEEKEESGSRAAVSGLPPGMTEVRLLSLCGSQVEKVKMGTTSGTAEATFQSRQACQRFIARFNGRFVAASCLSVRLAH